MLDKTGSLPVSFAVQIYRIVSLSWRSSAEVINNNCSSSHNNNSVTFFVLRGFVEAGLSLASIICPCPLSSVELYIIILRCFFAAWVAVAIISAYDCR